MRASVRDRSLTNIANVCSNAKSIATRTVRTTTTTRAMMLRSDLNLRPRDHRSHKNTQHTETILNFAAFRAQIHADACVAHDICAYVARCLCICRSIVCLCVCVCARICIFSGHRQRWRNVASFCANDPRDVCTTKGTTTTLCVGTMKPN